MKTVFGKLKEYLSSPEEVTDQIMRPFQRFFHKEVSSSLVLLFTTIVALAWANSPFSSSYHSLWHSELSFHFGGYTINKSLHHWINDGLMALFFFTVGLEIKREMLVGELATFRKAFLPVTAAVGGMVFPALIYFLFNHGTETVRGWGIPMATDIAFALGALALLGKRIPISLRIFLSAFAIADDLGAVLVIAFFYTKEIVWNYLFVAFLIVFALALANFLWVRWTLVYALLGIGLWLAILGSGLHATVAGIVVAMFIPARGRYDTDRFIKEVSKYLDEFQCGEQACGFSILLNSQHLNAVQSIEMATHNVETPLQRLEHALHPWVAFVVIPLFALANAGLTLGGVHIPSALISPITLGILTGLLLGKPIGITICSYLAVKTGLAALPADVRWRHIIGASILGGIGFTMSLFISILSFSDLTMLEASKLGILLGSFLSGVIGFVVLRATSTPQGTGPQ